MLANCRSIVHKIDSVNDYFDSTNMKFGIFTETWTNDENIGKIKEELENGVGLDIIVKNRKTRGGGVAVVFKKSEICFKKHTFFTGTYEFLAVKARLAASNKMLYVFALYYPPSMLAEQVEKMNDLITDEVLKIQIANCNPYIVIAGDMNMKKCDTFLDIPNVNLIVTEPTRKENCLDLCYTNMFIKKTEVHVPLWSSAGVDSDHKAVLYEAKITEKKHTYKKITKRNVTKKGEEKFCEAVNTFDWSEIEKIADIDDKVDWLHNVVENFKNECFPYKTIKIRSDEDPWITEHIRKLIRKRDAAFREGKKSDAWKTLKWEVRDKMRDAKKAYYDREVEKICGSNDKRSLAYVALKNINCPYRKKQWTIMDLDRERSEEDTVEVLADFFNGIVSDYEPLDLDKMPRTYDRPTYALTNDMVEKRIRMSKKPNSIVPGDFPPKLINNIANTISGPITNIFNAVPAQRWPKQWKKEYQTVIPKKQNPEDMSELRNLSCTNFLSKVLESFVQDAIRSEISISELQYGGIKGCGTDNFLMETWNNILETVDERGKAVSLMSVDFSKAFNRLDHNACLKKLAEKSASNQTISLVASFLHERTMCVRSGNLMSGIRSVRGGSPQGTKLGNLLFCLAIDDITDPPIEKLPTTPTDEHEDIESAIPAQYLPAPEYTSTPTNALDDSFNPNPYGFREKKGRINDTIPYELAPYRKGSDVGTWEIGYIDDMNVGETLDVEEAVLHITTRKERREIRAGGSERMYGIIEQNGKEVGMLINSSKTQLLCISSNPHAEITSCISVGGKKVTSGKSLKILGFLFGTSPTPKKHVEYITGKFNRSIWSLLHLRRAGMSECVQTRVYCSMVRPVLEYGSNVICSMMTDADEEMLEKCQRTCLKIIYGFGFTYSQLLEKAGITSLKKRRRTLYEKFCLKAAASERFRKKWLPEKCRDEERAALRGEKKYIEFWARTDKLYRSPIYEMRRFLNTTEATRKTQ